MRMEMRLLKAVSLLRDPSAKVINVAEACGFNHLGLFNTCFKKRFGTSPGQWRKRTAKEDQPPTNEPSEEDCPLRLKGFCPIKPTRTKALMGTPCAAEITGFEVALGFRTNAKQPPGARC